MPFWSSVALDDPCSAVWIVCHDAEHIPQIAATEQKRRVTLGGELACITEGDEQGQIAFIGRSLLKDVFADVIAATKNANPRVPDDPFPSQIRQGL